MKLWQGWAQRVRWVCAAGLLSMAATPCAWAQNTPEATVDCPAPIPELTAEVLQAAQANARDRGMLWRLQRDGHVSHLFGTVHVGRMDWLLPGPQVRDALRVSDALAVEVDISDPATTAAFMAALAPAPALPKALQARVEQVAKQECADGQALQSLPALLQATTLELLAARRDGFETALAQELVLTGAARSSGLPVHSLESAALQAMALTSPQPGAGERLLKRSLDDLQAGHSRPVMVRMASAWERGDLADLAAFPAWCRCIQNDEDRALFKRLNDDRNPHLARRIAALHGQGQRVFAAVGILHMTGPLALPALLEREGFVVERVQPE